MKLRKIWATFLAMTLSVSLLGGCNEDTSEGGETTTEAPAIETTTEAPVVETTTAAPEVVAPVLNIASGEIENIFNPVFATAEGDKDISDLIHVPLLMIDRSGEVLYSSIAETNNSFKNVEYTYQGISDVTVSYDQTTDISTFMIKLAPGVKFSDGSELTADDVIFTYYVLCDASYDGPSTVKNQGILGIEAYQKNNSAAPGVTVSESEISKALGEPSEELKNAIIEQIIRPVLEEEKVWCEANWQKYVDRGYGDSAEEFFVTLYTSSLKPDYSIEGKTFHDIVDETVKLFGMNYKALAKNYQGDLDFFDAQVEQITEEVIYQGKLTAAGGVEVPNIQGIRKVDEYTVAIDCKGNDSQDIYSVCNIRVLPMHYYGDENLYDYDENRFGFTRGDLSAVKAKSAEPLGAGPYTFIRSEAGDVYLEPNLLYYGTVSPDYQLKVSYVAEEARLDAVLAGEIDIAQIPYDKSAEEILQSADGVKIQPQLVDGSDYFYFGINASMVKIGEDSNSEQSVALRKAFATLLAAERANIGQTYYGTSANVIEYTYSASSWAYPEAGENGYISAYSLKSDGTPIYTEGQSLEERQAAAKQAAIEYLILAGYTYHEEEGKFTAAPEGGKMEFSALIPYYFSGDTAMMAILNQMKTVLEGLGFVLNFEEAEDIDAFGYELVGRKMDLWCGERDTFIEPYLTRYYHNEGGSNYYCLNRTEMDDLLKASHQSYVFDEKASVYRSIFDMILDSAVEVPVFQRQEAILFNVDKIQADTVPVLSQYYEWTDGLSVIVPISETAE